MGRQTERYRDYLASMKHIEWTIYSFSTAVFIERFIDRVGAKVDTFVSQLELQRGKAQATKSRLVSVLNLIGSESGVTFLDQPHNEVKQNQTIKDYLWDSIEDCPFLLIDWWIDWLIDWWIDWLIDGLMDWWIDGLMDWLIDKTCIYSILILWSVDTLLLLPVAIWYHSGISRLLQSASCWSQVRRVHVSYCCLSSQIIWIRDVLQLFLLSLKFSGWTASMESTALWMASVWIVMNLNYQRNLFCTVIEIVLNYDGIGFGLLMVSSLFYQIVGKWIGANC